MINHVISWYFSFVNKIFCRFTENYFSGVMKGMKESFTYKERWVLCDNLRIFSYFYRNKVKNSIVTHSFNLNIGIISNRSFNDRLK